MAHRYVGMRLQALAPRIGFAVRPQKIHRSIASAAPNSRTVQPTTTIAACGPVRAISASEVRTPSAAMAVTSS